MCPWSVSTPPFPIETFPGFDRTRPVPTEPPDWPLVEIVDPLLVEIVAPLLRGVMLPAVSTTVPFAAKTAPKALIDEFNRTSAP